MQSEMTYPVVDREQLKRALEAERAQITQQTAQTAGEPDDAALLEFDADDAGNGDALAWALGDSYLVNDAFGWMRWTGTHYDTEGAESALKAATVDVLRRRRIAAARSGKHEHIVKASVPSSRHVRDAIERLRAVRYVPVGEFDRAGHLLNVSNGVLDLRTGQLVAHETSNRFTYCVRTDYDPQADTTELLNYLRGAVGGGEAVIEWLQSWLGYGVTGETNLEQLLYIYGPTRSGKGTLTESLIALLGRIARSVDFTSFTAKRDADTQNFDLAPLKSARLIVAGEGTRQAELNASKIKQITGGDDITCAFKHRDVFTYRPQFKIVLVSNHPLNVDVDDSAAWARVRVVEFPHSHVGSEDYSLKARMKSPENLRALLVWLAEGARRYYAAGARGIVTPDAVRATTQAHRDALDFIGQWITARVIRAPDSETTSGALWRDYAKWCEENGASPKHAGRFRQALAARGFEFRDTNAARGVVKGWRLR